MKGLLTLLGTTLFCCSFAGNNNAYRTYLLQQLYAGPKEKQFQQQVYTRSGNLSTLACIPKYSIPKGNVFCIMEDKLTKATGIWIKVGVK